MTTLLLGSASLLVTACGGAQEPAQTTAAAVSTTHEHPTAAGKQAKSMCPFAAPETEAIVEDTSEGVTVTFSAPADRVEALQKVGAKMAALHQKKHQMHDGKHGHMHGKKHMHPEKHKAMTKMPAADVTAANTETGVRLHIRAKNPDDVTAVQEHARKHVNMMKQGKCPMMGHGECPMMQDGKCTMMEVKEGESPAPDGAEHKKHHPEN